ncbi:MAG: MFS transporter [Chloroflexi bacterium]|nr:MFS transporter [Chloroflexota bacterium]
MLTNSVRQRPRIFYGWWIAISFFFINFYWSGILVSGFTAFFTPWKYAFGLSSATTSLAFSMQQGMAAVGAVVVGALFDRFGGRVLMLVATALGALGLLMLSASHAALGFFLSFFVLSLGYTIFYAGIGPALAAIWFRKHRGKANGLLLCGSNLGGVLAPLLVWIIDTYSWRTATIVSAIGLVIVGIPTSLVLRHTPERYGLLPDGAAPPTAAESGIGHASEARGGSGALPEERDFTLKEAMKTWAFWSVALSQALAVFGLVAVFVHILPHLENEGFSRATGARVVMVVTIIGLGPRLGFGWLGDVVNKRFLLAGADVFQGVGILSLAYVENTWTLVLFVVLYGLAAQSFSAVLFSLLADHFGRRHIGVIQGVVLAPYVFGAILGPYLAGVTFDALGSYTWVFVAFGCATLISGPIALTSREPRVERAV